MEDNNMGSIDIKKDDLTDLLNELGIKPPNRDEFKLILWNDDINSMQYVSLALLEVCNLSLEESIIVMLDAHKNNKALAKIGTEAEIIEMKRKLNERYIEATVEQ